MFKFKYVPFNVELLKEVLKKDHLNPSLYLFPTRKSRNEAKRLYLEDWDLSSHEFLTMDEWKETLFITDKPILKEEKRTLALFRSLTDETKDFFRIKKYHHFIDFADKFFNFWEEIREELIAEPDITDVISRKDTAGNWQIETFQQLLLLRTSYQDFLEKIGFTDRIFINLLDSNSLKIPFKEIIVVNQFYFTRLEKDLLQIFSGDVHIISQIPQNCFDEDTLSISDKFNAELISPYLTSKPKLFISSNPLQMIARMCSSLSEIQKATIIDFKFEQQSYAHLLAYDQFSYPLDLKFNRTLFYRFFQAIHELLSSISWEGKPFLISLQSLINLTCSDDIFSYFVSEPEKREDIRTYLFDLINKDYKFVDLNLFEQKKKEFSAEFEGIFTLLQDLMKIRTIKQLNSYIIGLGNLEYLVSDLSDRSDIIEVLFSSLVDFEAIEAIDLIDKWKDIFPSDISSNLIILFINYIKSKKITLSIKRNTHYNISTLHNSRNLNFNELFILNVIEGILPDKKHNQFLFSENQRRELGLKTYDDITLRDKYYFYRLLACSKQAHIFSRQDQEENVEISSFLEELKLNDLLEESEVLEAPALSKQIFNNLISIEDNHTNRTAEITDKFFSFPFNISDFPEKNLALSFYPWERLRYRTFEFFLEDIEKIKNRESELLQDFSPRLIGTIAHEIINLVWSRIVNVYSSRTFKHNFIYNIKLYVDDAINNFLEYNRKFIYQSPHNYSNNYFQEVFLPILRSGIENFFYSLHNELKFSDIKISVYSESGKYNNLPLFRLENIEIHLTGRPDLRIETDEQKYIFDYKTGRSDRAKARRFDPQLQFYELIYYQDIIEAGSDEIIQPYLYFIEQKKLESLSKRIDIEESVIEKLRDILENGYRLNEKKHSYENGDITRRDLLIKRNVQ